MAATPRLLTAPAPYDGLDLSVAPHQLPPERAWVLSDFLVHEDARLTIRGPMRRLAPSGSLFKADGVTGLGTHFKAFPTPVSNGFVFQPIEAAATPWWPWRMFDPNAPLSGAIDQLSGYPSYYDPPTNVWGKLGAASVVGAPGPQFGTIGGVTYSMTTKRASTSQTISYQGRLHPVTFLVKFGPTLTGTCSAAAVTSQACRATNAIANYGNRLWAGGGIAPSSVADALTGSTINNKVLTPNTLYFTNPDADPMAGIASWQTSGVTNNIVVGSETPYDRIVALAAAGRYLFILKRFSTWLLTGTSQDTFALRQISSTIGCVDPRSVLVKDDVVYWLSAQKLMSFDGVELRDLSQRVNPILRAHLLTYGAPTSDQDSICTVHEVGDDYLNVLVGRQSLGGVTDNSFRFNALYHVPTGRWTYLTSAKFNKLGTSGGLGGFAHAMRVQDTFYGLDQDSLMDYTYLTRPQQASASDRGRDPDDGGSATAITLSLSTAPLRLSGPFARSQVQRVGVDYYWQVGSGVGVPQNESGVPLIQPRRFTNLTGNEYAGTVDLIAVPQQLDDVQQTTLVVDGSQTVQTKWFKMKGPEALDIYFNVTRDTTFTQTLVKGTLLGFAVEVVTPTHRRT